MAKGQYDDALRLYEKALKIDVEVFGELNAEVAKRYNNIGVIYARRAERQKALEYFQKSLSIRQQTLEADHPDFQTSFQNLGLVNQGIGDFETARNYLNRMVDHALVAFGPDHPNTADSYLTFGDAYLAHKDHGSALRYYQKAIITLVPGFKDSSIYANPHSQATNSAPILLKSLFGKAKAFAELYASQSSRLKDLEAALQTYQRAAALIEAMRRSYHREDSRLGFGESAAEIYDHAIRVAHALFEVTGKTSCEHQAFAFIEQNKAAVLWQALSEARAKTFVGAPPRLLSEEKALQIDLASYETQLQKEKFKKGGRDSITIRDFEARLFYLRRDYEALLARLENKYPKYYELKYQARAATISALKQALEARTALLEYALSDSTLHIVLVTQKAFEIAAVAVGPGFREKIGAFHRALHKVEKPKFLALGAEMYRRLIASIAPRQRPELRQCTAPGQTADARLRSNRLSDFVGRVCAGGEIRAKI